MNRIVKISTSLVAIASLMTLAGCGDEQKLGEDAANIKGADYLHVPYDQLKDGGKLTLSTGMIPEQLNPMAATATFETASLWYWWNPVVALFDDDGNWEPNPDYVTKAQDSVTDGKTVVVYDLNDKAKFNDDTPIDWKVWEGTWKAGSSDDPKMQLGDPTGYQAIEKVERGENDFQVKVTYKGHFPWWRKNFNYLMHPGLAASGENFGTAYLNNPHPEWGAGPYKVESIDNKGGTATFVKNEKWWGDPGKLDNIYFRALESTADMQAFKNKEIDVVGVGTKDRLAQLTDDTPVYAGTSLSEVFMTLNSARPALKDINVRKAVMKAIDRKIIMKVRFQGMNFEGDLLNSLILKQTQPGYEDNMGDLGVFDPEAAGKLLDEAGWKLEEGKTYRTNAAGEELVLERPYFGNDDLTKSMNNAIQSMLKNVGINFKLEQRPNADYPQIMKNREFDVMISSLFAENSFAMADICQFYGQGHTLLKSGTGSQEVDDLCAASLNAETQEEATKLGNQAEKAALKLAGAMPVYTGPTMVATTKGLANMGAMGFARKAPQMIGWAKDDFKAEK
ncbi:hypothetical protein BK816_03200 [Boudabousia tangfeifanii]|uniref:Solute-binding protein family 5 domain-containing protein n=1 Tax=Boudabousia tangfeifanii TaxID=1912795 RepID=A0A1D9MJQ5_9ACTO|nr:ABC transporter family substrate-binding protein [Boudabousia tangfeifanii]AOZ72419.1 hypothetical protein BK816_03200 [Boudabousia tangfeifanii]